MWNLNDLVPFRSKNTLNRLLNLQDSVKDAAGTHINEADVKLLGSVASLQVASHVQVVVPDDACDDVRGGDALCPLCGCKHA